MPRAIPGPGDFVTPGAEVGVGELSPVNEGVFREEAEPVVPRPRPVAVPPPQKKQMPLGADPFQPIREVGREEVNTIVFIVPDERPFITIPLSGPGVYQIQMRKTVENRENEGDRSDA